MRRPLLILLAALGACSLSLSVNLPKGKLTEIARSVCSVGHPLADFEGAEVIGGSAGGCASGGGERYVDVAIKYRRKLQKTDNTMKVRFHVDGTEPCEVRSEVLSDDGPAPVLLDNELASPAVGQMVCDALTGEGEETPAQ
ncbi:MAG: hypothetical protein H6741_20660 [Alphaproteobacteria bacterium]|nr:hypothetical protein [Alphaproteobacteria bacterium]MCB9795121.1 hypothetical protein [Alphaproteobacteria bacterium]